MKLLHSVNCSVLWSQDSAFTAGHSTRTRHCVAAARATRRTGPVVASRFTPKCGPYAMKAPRA